MAETHHDSSAREASSLTVAVAASLLRVDMLAWRLNDWRFLSFPERKVCVVVIEGGGGFKHLLENWKEGIGTFHYWEGDGKNLTTGQKRVIHRYKIRPMEE